MITRSFESQFFDNISLWVILCSNITKEIQIILRLFLVIAMYCQASSSQIKSITQPFALLAGLEGSLGACSS